MVDLDTPPSGWRLDSESVTHDGIMDRDFTTLVYRDESDDRGVRIRDVQEPNSFGGWGYLVWTTGTDSRELDLVETIDSAAERAFEYMRSTTIESSGGDST